MPSFPDMTLSTFLDDLASGKPTPGGGSGAALAGALGAALVSMVGNLTVGREKFKDVEADVAQILATSEDLRRKLLSYIDDDVAAFNAYSAAAKLPRETDEQKKARSVAIQATLKKACDPPMNTVAAAAAVLDLALPIAEKGNVAAVSDAGVGAILAEAALRSAALNVEINLAWIKDVAFVEAKRKELAALTAGRSEQKEDIVAFVKSKL